SSRSRCRRSSLVRSISFIPPSTLCIISMPINLSILRSWKTGHVRIPFFSQLKGRKGVSYVSVRPLSVKRAFLESLAKHRFRDPQLLGSFLLGQVEEVGNVDVVVFVEHLLLLGLRDSVVVKHHSGP